MTKFITPDGHPLPQKSGADPGFSQEGAPILSSKFSKKFHEIEKIVDPWGRAQGHPLRSATGTCILYVLFIIRIKLVFFHVKRDPLLIFSFSKSEFPIKVKKLECVVCFHPSGVCSSSGSSGLV